MDKMNKIREIIEKYVNGYFAVNLETGEIDKKLSRHIEARWFDKLEEELFEYCDREVLIAIVELAYDEKMEITIRHTKEK